MLFHPKKKVQNLLLAFSLLLLLGFLLVEVRGSYEEPVAAASCLECHKEDFDEDLARVFIHQPCLEKRCLVCHCSVAADAAEDDAQARSIDRVAPVSKPQIEDYELTVIDATLHSDFSHSFLFSDDKVEDVLLVELWQGKELQKVERVALMPLDQLPRLVDDEQPPQFSDIRVEKVERGPSSSAVITWKTDEPATSAIRYGLTELNHNSSIPKSLTRNHRVTLDSLRTNRQYQFSVVSKDFFGNQAVSDCLMLSTEKADGEVPVSGGSETSSERQDYSISRKQFYNADGRYLVLFELSRDLSLSIGIEDPQSLIGELSDSLISSASESEKIDAEMPGEDEEDEHRLLLDEVETTIDNCFTCHRGIRKEMSHPIEILPPPGMQVPEEYPLLSNGEMSCMTCHVRHGGDHPFRLIRAQGKKFCNGCHVSY